MAGDPNRAMVDTNVLVTATDRQRPLHHQALRLLTHDERRLCVTPQIIREYLVVATRPADLNGLGHSHDVAASNARLFVDSLEVVNEDLATVQTLHGLVESGLARGKQIHDANIAAAALTHAVGTIVTTNTRDFERFADLMTIEPL